MAMIPAFQLADAPDQPGAVAVLIEELMPVPVIVLTNTLVGAPAYGDTGAETGTVGYAS